MRFFIVVVVFFNNIFDCKNKNKDLIVFCLKLLLGVTTEIFSLVECHQFTQFHFIHLQLFRKSRETKNFCYSKGKSK